ncbi:MAG: F0F1 ATP synthase subunit epsilon [Clostridiales Family XIII bacterium]|nr:F0F1 ATP synthase subunit epsilon [Clostridiales Family XIII bacterium]
MPKSVLLDIITPEKLFYRGEIELVIARTLTGDEGFMASHIWACKLLATGELWIQEAGKKDFRIAAVSGGFIDIKDKFTIFTDYAEWPEEIDVERAKRSGERAKEWLKEHTRADRNEQEILKARVDMSKARTRIGVAGGGLRRKR